MRRSKKSLIGLLPSLLCILTMFLAACSNNTSNPSAEKAPDSKQVFRYPIQAQADFQSLDPALVQAAGDGYAIATIFTGLVQFDNNGNVKDQLAQSHEVSSDGLTYTFHLRPNLKFSDGAALNANDVAYSINRALLPETKSQVAPYYLKQIKGASDVASGKIPTIVGTGLFIKDDNTISIVITQPAAYFLDVLTYPVSYVVEKSLVTKYGPSWTDHLNENGGSGGAGPFKVKSYEHGKTFNVVANPNYYGPQPGLKEIDFPFASDQEAAYKAYKNGQYDWVFVPAADLQEAQKRTDFYRGSRLVENYVSFNFLAAPFDNLNIRKAFALAINKEIIAKDTTHGAVSATNHIVPQGMYGYNPNLKGPDGTTKLTGNQTLAQQLLTKGMHEKGYTAANSLPALTLTSYNSSATFVNVVNEIASEWKTVLNVDVKVNLVDFATLSQEMDATNGNDNLQMWAYAWLADYPDPQDWLSNFFGSGQGGNHINYGKIAEEQAVQTKLSKADVELDSTKRANLYNEAEQQLVNDIAWLPLYQSSLLIAQNPKLHGYKTNALQITDPDSWKDVYFTV